MIRFWKNITLITRSPKCIKLKEDDPNVPKNATTRDLLRYFIKRVDQMTYREGLNLAGWEDGLQETDREELSVPYPIGDYYSDEVYSYQWYNMWEEKVGGGTYRFANHDYKVSGRGTNAG
jgi:N-acetyl-beta-hexosaminidase